MNAATLLKYLLLILISMLLAAPAFGYDLRIHDAPNWVNDGTVYTTVKGERYFYGVGSSPVVGEPDLQKAISRSRAKSEAKRIFSDWMEALVSDYKKSENFMDDTGLQKQLKTLEDTTMAQAELAARWRDPRTGSLYSLMLFNMEAVKRAAASNEQVDTALREHIRKRGDRIFDSVKRSSKKRPHRP